MTAQVHTLKRAPVSQVRLLVACCSLQGRPAPATGLLLCFELTPKARLPRSLAAPRPHLHGVISQQATSCQYMSCVAEMQCPCMQADCATDNAFASHSLKRLRLAWSLHTCRLLCD